jgi:hypothetical protein
MTDTLFHQDDEASVVGTGARRRVPNQASLKLIDATGVVQIAIIPWQSAQPPSFGCGDVSRWNGLPARPPQWRDKPVIQVCAYSTLEAEHETFHAVVADNPVATARRRPGLPGHDGLSGGAQPTHAGTDGGGRSSLASA